MKRKLGQQIAKLMGYFFAVACIGLGMQMTVSAAGTVSVTADKSSMAMSENVTVTVQTSDPEDAATAPQVSVTYDSDILTFVDCDVEYGGGGGGLITFTGQSAKITFTAAKTGNVTINAEAIIDEDGNNPAMGAALISIGGATQGNLSSDATLRALAMNPGKMEPDFSPEVTEYKIVIDHSVTDITVSGGVTDEKAQITAASGFKNLKSGTNQAVITVTAEDGSTLTYHFTIVREEAETAESETEEEMQETSEEAIKPGDGLTITVDQMTYTLQTTVPDSLLPQGCVKTDTTFNGQSLEAALFEKGKLLLLYAVSTDSNEGEFFIYNEKSSQLQFFVQLRSMENRFIIPIEPTESIPSEFKEKKMQWNNSYLPAYVLGDSSVKNASDFYLLYAINNEGEEGFYLYDTMEGTYQRFLNYSKAKAVRTSEMGDNTSLLVIVGLIILLIGGVILIVNLMIRNKELAADIQEEVAAPRRKKAVKSAKKRPSVKAKEAKATVKKEVPKKEVIKKEVVQPEDEELDVLEAILQKKEEPPKVVQPKPAVKKTVLPQMEEKKVAGTVGITGNIPVTNVQTPKTERRSQVPIYTLERQPVQLTREAPPDQLDDDFEFEFINIDNE